MVRCLSQWIPNQSIPVPVQRVQRAAPSRRQDRAVVALQAVLGSKIVAVWDQGLITRGPRVLPSAKVRACLIDLVGDDTKLRLCFVCSTDVHPPILAGGPPPEPVDPGTGTGCPTCGTIKKTGQSSCCAPGGSWFKNCGGVGSKFDYTWTEGIAVCRGKRMFN